LQAQKKTRLTAIFLFKNKNAPVKHVTAAFFEIFIFVNLYKPA